MIKSFHYIFKEKWQHRSRLEKRLLRLLIFFGMLGLLAPLIANHEPLYIRYNGCNYFPAFSSSPYLELKDKSGEWVRLRKDATDWRNFPASTILFAPVVYDASGKDLMNANCISPFGSQKSINASGTVTDLPLRYRHWLGTTRTGGDVLAGLISGTRFSLLIGILSMLIAGVIGILLGTLAGYFGDDTLRISAGSRLLLAAGLLPSWFYADRIRSFFFSDTSGSTVQQGAFQFLFVLLIFTLLLAICFHLGRLLSFIPFLAKRQRLPVDSIISRFIEIFLSIPRLVLIITIAAISRPSVAGIILLIGCTSWTGTARMQRGEVLRLKKEGFVEAATALGYSSFRIMFHHLIPGTFRVTSITLIFGIASAILTEAGLSFIGVGVPHDIVTWGTLLSDARENFSSWWLVVFPGLMIFVVVYSLNRLGDVEKK
jgi:peptide/nickel transport system permease protein